MQWFKCLTDPVTNEGCEALQNIQLYSKFGLHCWCVCVCESWDFLITSIPEIPVFYPGFLKLNLAEIINNQDING